MARSRICQFTTLTQNVDAGKPDSSQALGRRLSRQGRRALRARQLKHKKKRQGQSSCRGEMEIELVMEPLSAREKAEAHEPLTPYGSAGGIRRRSWMPMSTPRGRDLDHDPIRARERLPSHRRRSSEASSYLGRLSLNNHIPPAPDFTEVWGDMAEIWGEKNTNAPSQQPLTPPIHSGADEKTVPETISSDDDGMEAGQSMDLFKADLRKRMERCYDNLDVLSESCSESEQDDSTAGADRSAGASRPSSVKSSWEKAYDEDGTPYFYNTTTNETTWGSEADGSWVSHPYKPCYYDDDAGKKKRM